MAMDNNESATQPISENHIVVVGAGVVGCTLALQLAEQGLAVTLVDASAGNKTANQTVNHGFDSRSIALSYGSFQYLSQLPLQTPLSQCVSPITEIQVSDKGHLGQSLLTANELHVNALGYVVELSKLGDELHHAIHHHRHITWLTNTQVTAIQQSVDHVDISLSNKQRLRARVIVAADGGQSSVKQLLQLPTECKPYPQHAIIANIGVSKCHRGRAFERFTDTGPLAMLPMLPIQGQDRYSLVWCLDKVDADRLKQVDERAFLTELQQAFGDRLGALVQVGERISYPLSLQYNTFPQQHRVVFVGNASQSIHPIAGQGFNLAVRDIKQLVTSLATANQQQIDVGSTRVLMDFYEQRKIDRQRVITTTDSLLSVFSNQHVPLVMGRNIGLMVLQHIAPVKHRFAKNMMGLNVQ